MEQPLEAVMWRGLLGAAGIAQWVILALPWVVSVDEVEVLDGPLSGWRLLEAGWTRPDGVDRLEVFVIAALPPLAWLLALALLVAAVVTGSRVLAGLTVAGSTLAGLGVLGLYLTGGEDTHGWASWDFEPVLFAGLGLWIVAAAVSRRLFAIGAAR